MFDATVLSKRLPSFSVPKITVIRHVKPILSCSKCGRPEQSYEKPPVPVSMFKVTNDRQKTYEIFHVYCIFYSGFMCQTTVIFGITKDGSLAFYPIAS